MLRVVLTQFGRTLRDRPPDLVKQNAAWRAAQVAAAGQLSPEPQGTQAQQPALDQAAAALAPIRVVGAAQAGSLPGVEATAVGVLPEWPLGGPEWPLGDPF